ncbi:MAG: ABC transporter permease subunit [Clostridia bacterium]|nr:ABC transporter permease subunit [Clostridia bacterium]
MKNKAFTKKNLWRVAAVLFWLLAWQAAAALLCQPLLLSSPVRVLQRLFALLGQSATYQALGYSLSRIALGFLLGFALGACLAVLAARWQPVEYLVRPLMLTVKSVPVASFIILALVFLTSRKLNSFISFLMVLPIVYGNLLEGLRSKSPQLDEMARMYRIPRLRRLLYIELPQLKPYLLSAVSLALGMSWKSGIAAEVIGIPMGSVGERLYQAKVYLDTSELYAWTLAIVLISMLIEKGLTALMKGAYARLERL